MKKIMFFILSLIMIFMMTSVVYASKKDSKSPVITNTQPFNLQRNVMIESKIILRFNENVQKGKSFNLIKVTTEDKVLISFTCEIAGNILSISPKKKLNYGTKYCILIPAAAVKDMSNNIMTNDYAISFVTEKESVANGNMTAEIDESENSTHLIMIESVMEEELTNEDMQYLIHILESLNIKVKNISIDKIEEESTQDSSQIQDSEQISEEGNEGVENTNEAVTANYDVFLIGKGNTIIQLVKAIRAITGLNQRDAKDLVDNSEKEPQLIISGVSILDAEEIARSIEEAGGEVSITGTMDQNAE